MGLANLYKYCKFNTLLLDIRLLYQLKYFIIFYPVLSNKSITMKCPIYRQNYFHPSQVSSYSIKKNYTLNHSIIALKAVIRFHLNKRQPFI